MFTNIVKDLYIGKSKLNIRFQNQIIEPETIVDSLGVPYPKLKEYPTFPDYVVIGNFDGKDIFNIQVGENPHMLLITGIPKGAKTLDWYRKQSGPPIMRIITEDIYFRSRMQPRK